MTSTQKKSPGGTGAKKALSLSDNKKPEKSSLKKHQRPGLHPGPKFWLKTAYDGRETAHESEPNMPHLRVEVAEAGDGRLIEQTYTRTRKVRFGGGGTELITPSPPASGGWRVREWPDPETIGSSATWWRPLSEGWKLDEPPHRDGKVWRRPHKGGAR